MVSLDIREISAGPVGGWMLHCKCTFAPAALRKDRHPLVIVPGYGMNAFIFGFHPRGTSMERCLAEAGFEVWSVNLRAQGPSRRLGRAEDPSLRAYAEEDLPAALEAILAHTHSTTGRAVLIGCSLGGSIVYAHLARVPRSPVAAICTIGAPLRMDDLHPLVRFAFGSPRLVERLKLRGARRLAGLALPLIRHAPQLLSIYMNAAHVDLSAASELVRTVEDPVPRVNRDIAEWIASKDLLMGGTNVSDAMRDQRVPLLLVLSNRDGIVPERAALCVQDRWGGPCEVLRVGDDDRWFAHADLFIADTAPERVFAPLARWAGGLG